MQIQYYIAGKDTHITTCDQVVAYELVEKLRGLGHCPTIFVQWAQFDDDGKPVMREGGLNVPEVMEAEACLMASEFKGRFGGDKEQQVTETAGEIMRHLMWAMNPLESRALIQKALDRRDQVAN